jgi:hypothetical protein
VLRAGEDAACSRMLALDGWRFSAEAFCWLRRQGGPRSLSLNRTALEGSQTAGTRARNSAPARSHREGGIMMRAHRKAPESVRWPVRPRLCIRPPSNVALQLSGAMWSRRVARLAEHSPVRVVSRLVGRSPAAELER